MTYRYSLAAGVLAAVFLPTLHVCAAAPRTEDLNWPCQQRLVPTLTAGAYWRGPPLDDPGDWRADSDVVALVQRLAPRRVSKEEGLSAIASFAHELSVDRPRRLALAFRGLLEETDRTRSALIDELTQIGRRQRELAELIARLAAERDAISPDASGEAAAKKADLQQRHDFTARNFQEIRRTIRYACEFPVELDARLGAWARALQEAAEE